MVCHITGTLYLSDGTACGNASLTVTRNPLIPAAQNGGVVMTAPRSFLSDGAGAVAFDLLAGQYLCDLTFATVKRQFVMNVPEAPSALIMACVEAAGVPLTAASTAAAQAAAALSLASANAAAVSAAAAQSALHVAYPSLAVAQASTPPATALYVSVTDGGLVTRYVADKSGTLTLADGSTWGEAEYPSGAVAADIVAARAPNEAAAALNLDARRPAYLDPTIVEIIDGTDHFPTIHLGLLPTGNTSQLIHVGGALINKTYRFFNRSTDRGAVIEFDCGPGLFFGGNISSLKDGTKRTFKLYPFYSCDITRVAGDMLFVTMAGNGPWITSGNITYRQDGLGNYDIEHLRASSAIGAGAYVTESILSTFTLTNARLVSATLQPRSDGLASFGTPIVTKKGTPNGLAYNQFEIFNPGAAFTAPILFRWSNVQEYV